MVTMSGASEQIAVRWCRRYKIFFLLGLFIASVQVFLAYKSWDIKDSNATANSFHYESQALQRAKSKLAVTGAVGSHNSVSDDEDASLSETNKNSANAAALAPAIATAQQAAENRLTEAQLGFRPSCDITTKEAISALQRAKTKACRQQIAEIVCAIQSEQFYATALPSYCPTGNHTANAPLGCYRDDKDTRLLTGYFTNFRTSNSPRHCIQLCLQLGYPYAGVQYGMECFCGAALPPIANKLADSSCNMKCTGDAREVCGGYFSMNIFETGIAKFKAQIAELSAKVNAEHVRIAFLLTLNGRALRQVHRLIRALYAPQHVFYIHVDAREHYLYRKLLELESSFSNIRLARKRFSTIWGGASLLTMLMQCMQDLLSADWEWDFVINLSESDFPVKTVNKLVAFLTANKGRNFVKSHGVETQRFIQKQGLDKTFVECDTHMWRVGDRKLPKGIQIDGGSDWVALSKPFVEYVILQQQKDMLLTGLLLIFRHTLLPAESFFHIVLRNSQFCNTYVDNNLHVTNWKRKLGCKCQYKHVVDWCGCSPNDFKPDDWSRLQGTEQKMLYFARKFEPIINQAIILQLEEWLFGAYSKDFINLHAYWQSFYNANDVPVSTDDLTRTIAESVLRSSARRLQLQLSSYSVQELTHYLHLDQYKGFLLRYKAVTLLPYNNTTLELETRIRPVQYTKLHKNSKLAKRLRRFEVSSDFDQKEQISRNFATMLGPYTEPVVSFTFLGANAHERAEGAHSYNLTLLWIDPLGRLQDFNELHMEDAQTDAIYFSKSLLKQPLLPGIWTVKLIGRSGAYAQTKFLIAPLALHKGHAILPEKAKVVNAGANLSLPADFKIPTEWLQHLSSAADVQQLQQLAQANAQRTGSNLLAWLDELIGKFFHLRETCACNRQTAAAMAAAKLPLCSETIWSSLAPDPKSNLLALSTPS